MAEDSINAKPRVLAPEALDFAPDLLAIQERPPERLPRVILITVLVLIGLLLVWAIFARLDVIASAEGRLVPVSFTKVVQPAEAGVVTEILVKEGDAVKTGQLLMRLDARLNESDIGALKTDSSLKRLSLRRIEAELADRPFVRQHDDATELFSRVETQYRAHRQAYLDSLAQEQETQNKLRADLQSAEQVLQKLTATLPTYRRTAEAYEKLHQQGFVGELAAAEKSREAIEHEQDLKAQHSNVESIRAVIAQSQQKLAGIRSSYRAQLENERVELTTDLNKVSNELDKSTIRSGMLDIRAPHDGIVKDMATTTQGSVVAAGSVLMNIVPRNEPVQAEVLLKNEDVGFVAVGQPVKVKIAAYQFQKYGLLDGRVTMVSADSSDPRQQQQGAPAMLSYKALVSLNTPALITASGERLELSPGMLVTAEIHQGDRSVIEYLLSPVKKVGMEAARER
ncbi:HlyD family type I secretion periplasmic adaptor subunit [Niveibacterium sp. 24ML]|uniref:HlyD family type I secretion periplasmic adaptor subunit n=1 Tax=Niveibacterium sp. 24ML TaxID=2985512 RepID=UPI00226EC491|nr:HlyD family type I secretion periplasmic adaptor subunit [Niveibacterium sp. 24ML]MCX9158045.1 HlyD family type I secretion periplasmic adaptor subunit [Niveibacterium sp. 24ML]